MLLLKGHYIKTSDIISFSIQQQQHCDMLESSIVFCEGFEHDKNRCWHAIVLLERKPFGAINVHSRRDYKVMEGYKPLFLTG
mmetsp:Transcript_7941/g.16383  ORF Transcript_7941/g.16383 Transcript_7941/m.16383 type:complete len:82 (+) Transcript_7941:647-892(+)